MKILKTSALAAVLALGSLSANAAYTSTDSFKLEINAADIVSITFDKDNLTFDHVQASDELDGSITYTLTGSSDRAMTCTITDANDLEQENNTFNIFDDANSTLAATIEIDAGNCAAGTNTLSVTGSVNANLAAGYTANTSYNLIVDYGATTTINGEVSDDPAPVPEEVNNNNLGQN